MADTPFIDILTGAQQTLIARKSLGANRPRYYSSDLAALQVVAKNTGTADPAEFDPNVQISADLEAVFILMPSLTKVSLAQFIGFAIGASTTASDLEMMAEVVDIRRISYYQINVDVAGPLLQLEQSRTSFLNFIDQVSRQQSETNINANGKLSATAPSKDPNEVLIPDLSVLFAALADDHAKLASEDVLAVHDRIADSATLFSYTDSGLERVKELSSWLTVILAYP